MSVARGETVLFTGVPFTELEHAQHESLSIDRGDVHIDAEDPDHKIRIKHTRGDGADVIAAIDKVTDTKTAYIDSQGGLHVAAGAASFDSNGKLTCKNVTCSTGAIEAASAAIEGIVQCDDVRLTDFGTGGVQSAVTILTSHASQLSINGLTITDLETVQGAHALDINAATHVDPPASAGSVPPNTIVRRLGTGRTHINNLTVGTREDPGDPIPGLLVEDATVLRDLELLQDGRLTFIPYDSGGTQIANKRLFFGRAPDQVGQSAPPSPRFDGITMENELNADAELVEIYADPSLPSLRITGNKNSQVDVINVSNSNTTETVFKVTDGGTVQCRQVRCDYLDPLSGKKFEKFRVRDIMLDKGSTWIGDKLHISESNGRSQMQYRLDVIPKYLQDLGVDAVAVAALEPGKTVATCTLDDWEALSLAAGGSVVLSTIFPESNVHLDFEQRTIVNQLLVKPQDSAVVSGVSNNAGVTIQNITTTGSPFLELSSPYGATTAGLVHFSTVNASGQKTTPALLQSLLATANDDAYTQLVTAGGNIKLHAVESSGAGGDINIVGTDCNVHADLVLAAGKQLQQGGVDLIAAAATDRASVRSEFAAADSTLTAAINTEKGRVDTILAGSSASLDTFIELSNAFQTADTSLSGLVSAQTTAHNADIATINSTASFVAADETWTGKKTVRYDGNNALRVEDTSGVSVLKVNTSTKKVDMYDSVTVDTNGIEIHSGKTLKYDGRTDLQGQVDSEISTRTSEVAALDVRLDTAEAKVSFTDPTTQTLLDSETSARVAADALKATIADPTFTTKITTPVVHTSEIMSQGAHLKVGSKDTNDFFVFLNNQESLQLTRTGSETRYQSQGGTGTHRFMNAVAGTDIDVSGTYKVGGAQISMSNLSDSASYATVADPTFTTKITTPVVHSSEIMSQGTHLKLGSKDTNDLNIFLNNQESLQITRSGSETRYQSQGGSGTHRFMNDIDVNGDVDISGTFSVNGSAIGSGPSNLTADSLSLSSALTNASPAQIVVTKDWSSGNSNDDESVARIVLQQTDTGGASNSVKKQTYESQISRADNVYKFFHRADDSTSVAASDMILMFSPTNGHIGIGGDFGGGAQHGDLSFSGTCMKNNVQTWGSLEVGGGGNNANQGRKLILAEDIGFVRKTSSSDVDILAEIAANTAARPAAPGHIYVQGSASSWGTVECDGDTTAIFFHTHGNSGNYWIHLPPKANTFEGMRIEIYGGHGSGNSKAYIRADPDDASSYPNHGLYENSTNLTNNYCTIPLAQSRFVCLYNLSTTKWWVTGSSFADF